jgi:RNA polymerase sigma factor (sigma-70 family)
MATSRAGTARAAVDLTFEELYRGLRADVYQAALRKLGNAQDAEDVTQAAFVDAYRAVLRGARPQSPRAWLLAISENVRRRRFRTAQRRPREVYLDDADSPLAAELPYEQSRTLVEALATLTPEQRRVFVLREIVGLSYDEIAGELDTTVASVQMLLFRARRSLRDQLDPPTVAIRRPLLLPPVPGWLAATWARVELATLTPRAAGALGAAVLAVGGASVAVPVSQADGLRAAPAVAAPAPAHSVRAPRATTARAAVTPAAPKASLARTAAARARTHSTPATGQAQPAAAAPVPAAAAAAPEAALAAAPVATAPGVVAAATPVVVGTRTEEAVRKVEEVAATVVDLPQVALPVPQAALPVPQVALPVPLPLPAQPLPTLPVTPPALPPVVETVTGAAGAAGASAPPLPVPAVPLPTLPHAP